MNKEIEHLKLFQKYDDLFEKIVVIVKTAKTENIKMNGSKYGVAVGAPGSRARLRHEILDTISAIKEIKARPEYSTQRYDWQEAESYLNKQLKKITHAYIKGVKKNIDKKIWGIKYVNGYIYFTVKYSKSFRLYEFFSGVMIGKPYYSDALCRGNLYAIEDEKYRIFSDLRKAEKINNF